MERKLFLGANLPNREHNYGYEGTERQLIKQYNLKKLYLLKGGSGLGKGTFMKKFANEFKDSTIDYYYCSGDVSSLDGIIIKNHQIGLIDATPPHILDPAYPGLGIDEIIDLSHFIIPEKIQTRREQIDAINSERLGYYKQANGYLTQALKSKGASEAANVKLVDEICSILETVFVQSGAKRDWPIMAYARSFTSKGVVDFKAGWAETPDRYITLKCGETTADAVFKRLFKTFGGYAFLHYLEPHLRHDNNLNRPSQPDSARFYSGQNVRMSAEMMARITSLDDIDDYMFEGIAIGGFSVAVDPLFEQKMDKAAVDLAIAALERADNFMHGKMEAEYEGCVDFLRVDAKLKEIINRHISG